MVSSIKYQLFLVWICFDWNPSASFDRPFVIRYIAKEAWPNFFCNIRKLSLWIPVNFRIALIFCTLNPNLFEKLMCNLLHSVFGISYLFIIWYKINLGEAIEHQNFFGVVGKALTNSFSVFSYSNLLNVFADISSWKLPSNKRAEMGGNKVD